MIVGLILNNNKNQAVFRLLENVPHKKKTKKVFVFAHGAGAPMDSDFMNTITDAVVAQGITVVRFEFPYMQERRDIGKKRPPNRMPELLDHFIKVIDALGGPEHCVIGGKSMGGRVASMVATELPVSGLICLGYPFHPAGKPEKLRIDHFDKIKVQNLILQGDRDPLGNQEEVLSYHLPKKINIQWVEDGDHDLKPRKKSGFSHAEHLQSAADAISQWIVEMIE